MLLQHSKVSLQIPILSVSKPFLLRRLGYPQYPSNPTTGQPTGGSTIKDAPSNKPLGATTVDSSGEAKQTAAEPSMFESDKGPCMSCCLSAMSGARSTPSLPQHSVPEAKTPSPSSSQAQAKVETIELMDMDDSFMRDPYLWLVTTDLTFML
jgi:hypothetical protein